jgi:hypothetical protein|tara:strand:- start:1079 stop:1306 length:228 start_codon:yes stop_codon:yes gene_type:complete
VLAAYALTSPLRLVEVLVGSIGIPVGSTTLASGYSGKSLQWFSYEADFDDFIGCLVISGAFYSERQTLCPEPKKT